MYIEKIHEKYEVLDAEPFITSKIIGRHELKISKKPYSTGDFLSRLWSVFGSPNNIGYEGFHYFLKHKETNVIFSAYSGGSGPSYGGDSKDQDRIGQIVKDFETLLSKIKPIDCSIEYETDFGIYISGSKDGIPFERPKNEINEVSNTEEGRISIIKKVKLNVLLFDNANEVIRGKEHKGSDYSFELTDYVCKIEYYEIPVIKDFFDLCISLTTEGQNVYEREVSKKDINESNVAIFVNDICCSKIIHSYSSVKRYVWNESVGQFSTVNELFEVINN